MERQEINNLLSRITVVPGLMGGHRTIRKMRFPVKDIFELLASGMTYREILDEHPDLEEDDIKASLKYASLKLDYPILHAAV